MYLLSWGSENERIESRAHFLVTESTADGQGRRLVAAGLVDTDSAARALAAKMVKGRGSVTVHETAGNYRFVCHTFIDRGGVYRFWQSSTGRKVDGLPVSSHVVVLHKRITDPLQDRINNEIEGETIILAPDGNPLMAFGKAIVERYTLPALESWFQYLYLWFRRRNWLEPLQVWSAPEVRAWRDLQAFALKDVDEGDVLALVSEGIRRGELPIPEGVTDAPKPVAKDLTAYLVEFAPHLATTLEDVVAPGHDLDRPLERAIATMKRVPFPAQAHVAQALVNGFDRGKRAVFSVGDMGTGKSIISLAVTNVLAERAKAKGDGFVTLILAPGSTVPKWIDSEIRTTIPSAKVRRLENWRDTVRWIRDVRRKGFAKAGLEFVVLGRDTAKLGTRQVPALVWKPHIPEDGLAEHVVYAWHCPDCGKPFHEIGEEEYDEEKAWAKFAYGLPRPEGPAEWKDAKKRYKCPHCGYPVTRLADAHRGEVGRMKNRRIEPAWLIKRYLSGYIDLLVVDELHQYKTQSGQGVAMGTLVAASRRTLGLTGTLSDGKASSLFHILARTDYARLAADGFDHKSEQEFIRRYGVLEIRTITDGDTDLVGGVTRGKEKKKYTEVPGLSPALFVNYLADKAAFLELGDLGLPLVRLIERPIFVDPDPAQYGAYLEAEQAVRDGVIPDLRAALNAGLITCINQPHREHVLELAGKTVAEIDPVWGPDKLAPKEQRLVDDVLAEIAEGRRCVVYATYTGKHGQDRRIAEVLEAAGVKCRVLSSHVDPEDRIEWLEKAVADDVQVVVTNVQLVEVGLDLLDFPTLIFYQLTERVSTLRQASRRAWRIGQSRECRVYYYVYNGTIEMAQFKRMMAKRSHAMLLEGRLDRSEMAKFVEKDQHNALSAAIAENMGDVEDLTAKWQELADKDIPAGVEMLDEEEYRREIGKAMKRLADETRRLCGVAIEEVEPTPAPVQDAVQVAATETAAADETSSSSQTKQVTIFEFIEERRKFGMVEKAKKVRKKKPDDGNEQLSFGF